MKRTLLMVAGIAAALALAACQKNESSTPKTGSTPPASTAPSTPPPSSGAAPATPSSPSDAAKK
ncbi:MAG TPA: hypothetical protein VFB01_10885 [Burkholderiales bacterium]|nr:hypothetical protein [Burkholderiales bacterium]